MATRATMAKVIALLRQYGYAAEGDITLGTITYWTDEQLQDIADRHKVVTLVPLDPRQLVGRTIYRLDMPKSYVMEDDTATIYDQYEAVVATTFEYDFNASLLTFDTNLNSDYKYYAECYLINTNGALAELWGLKAAQRFEYISFTGGDNSMSHDQEHKHCLDMQQHYRQLTITRLPRGQKAKWSIS